MCVQTREECSSQRVCGLTRAILFCISHQSPQDTYLQARLCPEQGRSRGAVEQHGSAWAAPGLRPPMSKANLTLSDGTT